MGHFCPYSYVYDNESGLYYLQSRYYDPEIGRFINADSYVSTGQGIIGNNMVAYCGNNPVANVDTDGDRYKAWDISSEAAYVGTVTTVALLPALDDIARVASATIDMAVTTACDLFSAVGRSIQQSFESHTVSKDIGNITSSYGKFQCDKAAESVVDYLKGNNQHGSLVTIHFVNSRGYIWSDVANTTISQNGFHVGVEYKGIVFCNVHPLGLPEAQWINDFHGTGEKIVAKIPF